MSLEKDASLSPAPEVGQIVQVRTRKFLVDRVEPASCGGGTLVGLLCLDDDAQGHALDAVWELELEKSILDRDVWKSIGNKESISNWGLHKLIWSPEPGYRRGRSELAKS